MKIYNLTIAYNDDTDEIEYIQESIDEETMEGDLLAKLVKDGFKDSTSLSVIEQMEDIAKA
tara:strand:- start:347 stop:529 length:183 start_codon:yes stop_codon:yes gene_type:complete